MVREPMRTRINIRRSHTGEFYAFMPEIFTPGQASRLINGDVNGKMDCLEKFEIVWEISRET